MPFNERGEIIHEPPLPPEQPGNNPGRYLAIGVGVFLLLFVCYGLYNSLQNSTSILSRSPTIVPTNRAEIGLETPLVIEYYNELSVSSSATLSPRANPSQTPIVVTTNRLAVSTSRPTSTSSLSSTIIETNAQDGAEMVLVPAGEFIMGLDSDESSLFWGAEAPRHTVYLDAFWIYRTEVTNAMYQSCVEIHSCPLPEQFYSRTRTSYYGAPEFSNYPVIYVTWLDALAYCQWAGGLLPTEAQWEKAARGDDGIYYPWGSEEPNRNLINLCGEECPASERSIYINDNYPETAPVGSFPAGASPYGALDMAGNVWEWTMDYFQIDYYSRSPSENPTGPADGTRRVIRGGSWTNYHAGVWTAFRSSLRPDNSLDTLGFRCVEQFR